MTIQVLADGCLEGQRVVVSGAGSGIGRAIALRLVSLGAGVLGIGRTEESLAETGAQAVGSGTFRHATCDVRDAEQVIPVLQEYGDAGGIQGLVNNAGGQFVAPAEEISERGWRAVVDLNLDAVFRAIRTAYPYLAEHGGSVVNISMSGVERGARGLAPSVAARAGVLALTRTLALEWAARGIRLNCLDPGTVLTGGVKSNYAQMGEQVDRLVRDSTPMGRATDAAEAAELAALLLSPASAMITGQVLHADGGAHIGAGFHMLPQG